MDSSVIDSFKKLSENPENAEEIINNGDFNINNLTNVNFYIGQLKQTVQSTQQVVTEYVSKEMGVSPQVAKGVGFTLPVIVTLFMLYVLIKHIIKNVKMFIIISIIVVGLYIYFSA